MPERTEKLEQLDFIDRKAKSAGATHEPSVVAGERNRLSLAPQKIHRRQMNRIQGSYRLREGFQRAREHGLRKFYQSQAAQKCTHFVRVRSRQLPRVNSSPYLILDKPARDEGLCPEPFGRGPVLRQQMRERNGGIEVNQRSLRSWSSSFWRLRKQAMGLRGGGVDAASAGGVIQPLRTASESRASASTGLLVLSGGTISATTRSRSVTSTVSPRSASRTYSLSLFFKTFKPTAFTIVNVASSSSLCQAGYSDRVSESRYAEGKRERFRELAAELVRLKVDIIVVAGGGRIILVGKNATKAIPIVMIGAGIDSVEAGVVESLARPGGNITGLTTLNRELGGKRLELLKEAVPKLNRVAILYDPAAPVSALEMKEDLPVAARALRLTIQPWEVRDASGFERVFAALSKDRPGWTLCGLGPTDN
jgi:ABC transporter substrate binding protein